MKPFYDHWDGIRARLAKAERVILLLDYDGTLIPIKRHPSTVYRDEALRRLLTGLRDHPRFVTGIVSGRSLENLEHTVGIDGLVYAGNHGFEIRAGKRIHYCPGLKRTLPYIRRASELIARKIGDFPKAVLEDKGITLSVHYRHCSPGTSRALEEAFPSMIAPLGGKVTVGHGKKVWEIKPPLDWDKGKAVQWIIERYSRRRDCVPIYIGDDRTDEDAFGALPDNGISVHVGENSTSAASYYIKSITGVRTCLKLLTQI